MRTDGGSYESISEQVLFRMVRRALEADWLTDEEIAAELHCSRDFVIRVKRALTHLHKNQPMQANGRSDCASERSSRVRRAG